MYPNPTNGIVTINSAKGNTETVQVEVVDGIGKIVMKNSVQFSSNAKSHSLNLSELANGVYFIKLSPEKGKPELIKIIKE